MAAFGSGVVEAFIVVYDPFIVQILTAQYSLGFLNIADKETSTLVDLKNKPPILRKPEGLQSMGFCHIRDDREYPVLFCVIQNYGMCIHMAEHQDVVRRCKEPDIILWMTEVF